MLRRIVSGLSLIGAAATGLGALIGLGERRYRELRREIAEREDEFAAPPTAGTALARAVARHAGLHRSDESGHGLLADGPLALEARLALIDAAEATLDLQYYAWHDDASGRLVARAVREAAERGCRCRVLLDDLHASGTRDLVETLAAHPRVTVRIYNASLTRRAYYLHWLFAFRRLNRRMHNKALVADGAVAIVGGRNIGDPYFGHGERLNFRDCDVLVAGPSAGAIGRSFDAFWNAHLAMPSAAFGVRENAGRRVAPEREGILRRPFDGWLDDLVWCPSRLVDDGPRDGPPGETSVIAAIGRVIDETAHTLDAEMGYVVPTRNGIARLTALVGRGVRVRLTTNSFATSDVVAAHAGYARYRPAMLAAGVELHELRPNAPLRGTRSLLRGALAAGGEESAKARPASKVTLHSKIFVADGRLVAIGSFNLDPRSALDNSEIMLLVEDERFARQAAAFLAEGRAAETSFAVTLRDRRPAWRTERGVALREPGLTRPAAVLAFVIGHLPIERLL